MVNNEPQFLGVSFLKIDDGWYRVNCSSKRPDLQSKDNVHDIGNKLIIKTLKVLEKLVSNYKNLKGKKQIKNKTDKKYKKKDYNELLLKNETEFKNGLLKNT